MNININSIGDELQTMNVYLGIDDYVALFKKEVAFGTLLRVYEELGKIISSDEDRLREWLGDDWYKSVVDTTNKVASIINNSNTPDKEISDIYPLTVVSDRYTGTYSGGEYTAWNLYDYFRTTRDIYGRGDTPNEAAIDLSKQLKRSRS